MSSHYTKQHSSKKNTPIESYLNGIKLPKYGSAHFLRDHLIDFMVTNNLLAGDPFPSDNELASIVGKSRSAVRRALNLLQKDGWIERISGVGTFVGPRASGAEKLGLRFLRETTSVEDPFQLSQHPLRFAAVTAGLKQSRGMANTHGWYIGQMLDSFAESVAKEPIILEYVGDHCSKPNILASRLKQCCPDVFLCLGPPLNHMTVIGEARRLGLPCLLAGVRTPEVGLPNIYDDSYEASRLTVEYLAKLNHTRIGFVQVASISGWWPFDRFQGYIHAMQEFQLDLDPGLSLWLPTYASEEGERLLDHYLQHEKPSAVIFGCCWAVSHLKRLIHSGKYSVPDDFSAVVFDQHPQIEDWLGGVSPATVELPLRQIGFKMAEFGKKMILGENVPLQTALPCTLVSGRSVAKRE